MKNNKTKWFDVSINNNGEEQTVWASEHQIDISLNDNYFEKSKNYQDPITADTVKSINGVRQMLPGDSEKITLNITMLWNLVETLLFECELDKFTKASESVDSELHRFNGLLDIIISISDSTKNEITKQLNFIEVSEHHKG